MSKIVKVIAREILDSRGNPTVEADVVLEGGEVGRAAVPSGASTGELEAIELRDGDASRYNGKGTLQAVANILDQIARAVRGENAEDQQAIDEILIQLDGTPHKRKLGANAILAVSMAVARSAAAARHEPLYRYLGGSFATLLPVPFMNVLNGGVHANNSIDFQEFLIVPSGAPNFAEALRMGVEVFHTLKRILQLEGYSTAVGDEGGFAPSLKSNEEAVELLLEAVVQSKLKPGEDVWLAIDPAASEFFDRAARQYVFQKSDRSRHSPEDMVKLWSSWVRQYPIISLEDGMSEHDWEGWKQLTGELGETIQLIGDDIFVTNPAILAKGIDAGIANAILIKLNQIGTITETRLAMQKAGEAGYATVVSHRSGETEDAFIADFTVATGSGQIKTGSASRSDRMAKYNQLLRIEEELGNAARFAGVQSIVRTARTAVQR
ncbi:MAG TPA: phosphopyruvate hydratase [Bryobacteraceae bacterium]|nr:phosphopyruvate hydratase [Bryobacteraceae bacterium]